MPQNALDDIGAFPSRRMAKPARESPVVSTKDIGGDAPREVVRCDDAIEQVATGVAKRADRSPPGVDPVVILIPTHLAAGADDDIIPGSAMNHALVVGCSGGARLIRDGLGLGQGGSGAARRRQQGQQQGDVVKAHAGYSRALHSLVSLECPAS